MAEKRDDRGFITKIEWGWGPIPHGMVTEAVLDPIIVVAMDGDRRGDTRRAVLIRRQDLLDCVEVLRKVSAALIVPGMNPEHYTTLNILDIWLKGWPEPAVGAEWPAALQEGVLTNLAEEIIERNIDPLTVTMFRFSFFLERQMTRPEFERIIREDPP
jgi:hypothetical protein